MVLGQGPLLGENTKPKYPPWKGNSNNKGFNNNRGGPDHAAPGHPMSFSLSETGGYDGRSNMEKFLDSKFVGTQGRLFAARDANLSSNYRGNNTVTAPITKGPGGKGGFKDSSSGKGPALSKSFLKGAVPSSSNKEGDWDCLSCGTHNFAYRTDCFQCGAMRGGALSYGPKGMPPPSSSTNITRDRARRSREGRRRCYSRDRSGNRSRRRDTTKSSPKKKNRFRSRSRSRDLNRQGFPSRRKSRSRSRSKSGGERENSSNNKSRHRSSDSSRATPPKSTSSRGPGPGDPRSKRTSQDRRRDLNSGRRASSRRR